jgi:hypothetical protein
MGLFQPANRQTHTHPAEGRCPMCEQPIGQDVARRIEERQRAQDEAALAKAQAAVVATMEKKLLAARAEAKLAAETALSAKLAEQQLKLVAAEQARVAADEQMAALKAAQEAAVEKRVAEIQEGLLPRSLNRWSDKEVRPTFSAWSSCPRRWGRESRPVRLPRPRS